MTAVTFQRSNGRIRSLAAPGLALVGILVAWEAIARIFQIETFILPRPSGIVASFIETFGTIVPAGLRTLIEALGGLVAGTVMAVIGSLAMARWSTIREGVMPVAIAANSAPIVALAPITNALFGSTNRVSKMAVVAVMVFFPILINTSRGLLSADPTQLELMRSMASRSRDVFRQVRIPAAWPYFFSAMKIAVALSLIGAIVAEYFGGPQDVLGQYIVNRAQLFQFADAWAGIVVASLMGIGLYLIVVTVERLVMPWHVSLRTEER